MGVSLDPRANYPIVQLYPQIDFKILTPPTLPQFKGGARFFYT